MKKIFIIISLVFFLISCGNTKNWNAYVYPDGIMKESSWKIKKGFNSLNECRKWSLQNIGNNSNSDYECGYKCELGKSGLIDICEKTER